MKKTNIFSMAALAFFFAACTEMMETEKLQSRIVILEATLSPNSASTRTLTDNGDGTITAAWAKDDAVRVKYTSNEGSVETKAIVTDVNEDGYATITAELQNPVEGTSQVWFEYPYQNKNPKQDQTGKLEDINQFFNTITGDGQMTVESSVATLPNGVKMTNQNSILKLTVSDGSNDITKDVTTLTIELSWQENNDEEIHKVYTITNLSQLAPIYVSLNNPDNKLLKVTVTAKTATDTYTITKEGITLEGGKSYTSTGLKLAKMINVTGVTLDQSKLKMELGDEPVKLTATVVPENATDIITTWNSSDENVATVDDGVITPLAVGKTTITINISSANNNYDPISAMCEVTVTPKELFGKECPLTFEARSENVKVTFNNIANDKAAKVEYTIDGGATWTKLTSEGVNLENIGDKVAFRGDNQGFYNGDNYYKFWVEGYAKECYVYGNIMSIIKKEDFANETKIPVNNAFYNLFKSIPKIELYKDEKHKLLLPAETLTDYCYYGMFSETKITWAPELPAKTMKYYCYGSMFSDCKNLKKAPELPAETLEECCYHSMFINCHSLTTTPYLRATTMKKYCYLYMFRGCEGLNTALDLPAKILAEHCYEGMFYMCPSLTKAPHLPATTLVDWCYYCMFLGCTQLGSVTCKAKSGFEANSLGNWLQIAGTADGCERILYVDPDMIGDEVWRLDYSGEDDKKWTSVAISE